MSTLNDWTIFEYLFIYLGVLLFRCYIYLGNEMIYSYIHVAWALIVNS